MAKIDLVALARQYLEEADKLREKYDAPRAANGRLAGRRGTAQPAPHAFDV